MDQQLPAARDVKRLENPSQLLLRHLDEFQGSSILVVGYPDDDFGLLLTERFPESSTTLFSFDYAAHRRMRQRYAAAGLSNRGLVFDSWYSPPTELHDVAVVFLPKSRALIDLTLTMIAMSVQAQAKVFLVGANNAGIRSSRSALEKLIGGVTASDAARHCVLYRAHKQAEQSERKHLFDWIETFEVEVRGLTLSIRSLPGVFSHGQLDAGTAFLLDNIEIPPRARILDFGCGAGLIGVTVKILWPETEVDMVDTNALALESSRQTMQLNNLSAERIWASDVFSDVSGRYTRILSNPPFHKGVETDYRVIEEFFKHSAAHLDEKGAIVIVANRFLKYRPLIEKHFKRCREIAENKSYRVYEGLRA
jgi:16S rRNA (guanine1207-N2)-methyltransferase